MTSDGFCDNVPPEIGQDTKPYSPVQILVLAVLVICAWFTFAPPANCQKGTSSVATITEQAYMVAKAENTSIFVYNGRPYWVQQRKHVDGNYVTILDEIVISGLSEDRVGGEFTFVLGPNSKEIRTSEKDVAEYEKTHGKR